MKSTSTIPTHRRLSTMAVGAAAALIMGGFGLSAAHAETTPAAPVTASANQTASATLAENLAFSREEERLARDLYQLFADTYDQARPFSNIVKSEQRHFDAVGTLLKTYGLDDPSEGRAPGSYAEDIGAVVAALAGLLGLAQRHDTGAGQLIDCASEHHYEVFAASNVKGKKAPIDAEVEKLFASVCLAGFQKFVGVAAGQSKYEVTYFIASTELWEKVADHRIVCSAGSPTGGVKGSLKGVKK